MTDQTLTKKSTPGIIKWILSAYVILLMVAGRFAMKPRKCPTCRRELPGDAYCRPCDDAQAAGCGWDD